MLIYNIFQYSCITKDSIQIKNFNINNKNTGKNTIIPIKTPVKFHKTRIETINNISSSHKNINKNKKVLNSKAYINQINKKLNVMNLVEIKNIYENHLENVKFNEKKLELKEIKHKKENFFFIKTDVIHILHLEKNSGNIIRLVNALNLNHEDSVTVMYNNKKQIIFIGGKNNYIYMVNNPLKNITNYYFKNGHRMPDKIINIDYNYPLGEGYYINSKFGFRLSPINGKRSFHSGVDMIKLSNKYAPVFAAEDGQIIYSGYRADYGNHIIIDHGHGFCTLYAHLARITVNLKSFIKKGNMIGNIGATGLATGPHLHFEVRLNNKRVNPEQTFYIYKEKQDFTSAFKILNKRKIETLLTLIN
jgi:murein DD-endopeptidase MepM/ murein hydrolase activator NlpD